MRMLILTARTGNGHTSAAEALGIECRRRGFQAEIVDYMDHVSDAYRAWFLGGYETLVKRGPSVWKYLYETSDRPFANYQFQTLLDRRGCQPVDALIRDFRPNAVLCTHSIGQPRLPKLRKELGFELGIVVTDLHPHRMWLRGKPDLFFVATEQSAKALRRRIRRESVEVFATGIPVNPAFCATENPMASRPTPAKAMNFPPIVLLSSGGIGAGPFLEAAKELQNLGCKVVALCGRNEATRIALESKFGSDPSCRILPQVSQIEMAELLRSADLLIGKSGGLTTFESLAAGCPFLVLLPFLIPGQEELNAAWIEQIGAGKKIAGIAQIRSEVQSLVDHPEQLRDMRQNALLHSRPNAARDIVELIAGRCSVGKKIEMPLA